MRVLLTNDDGIQSPNLHLLSAALRKAGHEVLVAAPASHQSGKSSAVTTGIPLIVHEVSLPDAAGMPFEGIAVHGTPADCILLAMYGGLFDARPDLVISGVNIGPNTGLDVFFSGTVGAAIQAAMQGIPTLAASHGACRPMEAGHAEFTVKVAERLVAAALPVHRVYNLNLPDVPAASLKGLKVCPHSTDRPRFVSYDERRTPDGRRYFWMNDVFEYSRTPVPGTDKGWLAEGWATLSPLKTELHDAEALTAMEGVGFEA